MLSGVCNTYVNDNKYSYHALKFTVNNSGPLTNIWYFSHTPYSNVAISIINLIFLNLPDALKGNPFKKLGPWGEPGMLVKLHTLTKLKLQTLYKMKGCSSTKSGILWDTTKSMKLHHIEPASWHFPRSLIVRAMRGQSATRSPSKQMVMIFRAVTNTTPKKYLTRKKQWKQSNLINFQVYSLPSLHWYKLNLNLFTFYKSKTLDIKEIKNFTIHTVVVGTILLG